MKHIRHLVIQQKGTEDGGSVETVSSAVIAALYNLSKDEQLVYDQNDLKGDLQCNATYQIYIDFLHTQYPNLNITATSTYFYLADPVIQNYWANSAYGDGIGITSANVALASSWPSHTAFKDNTDVVSFNELGSFINITEIPQFQFQNATNFTSIDLTNITSLGKYCFYGSGLTGVVNIPNLTTIPTDANIFALCPNITEINLSSNVPDAYKLLRVDNDFRGCTSLRKVTGLSQVTEIRGAFNGCEKLEQIDTTNKLTSLTDFNNTFQNCKELKCVDVSNVVQLPRNCFYHCFKLMSLSTSDPDNINLGEETFTLLDTAIKNGSFQQAYLNNKTLYYPNATSMEGYSHNGSSIKGFRAPSVTSIGGESSFSDCSQLQLVELGNVTSLPGNTFQRCANLVHLKIGSSAPTYNAQEQCVDVENSSILTLGHHCFANCSSLLQSETVEYTETVGGQEQTNTFTGRVKFKLLNCTSIGNGSFENKAVSEVYAPSTTFIDGNCFKGSSVQKVTIGNLTTINESCFQNCNALTTINFPSSLTSISRYAFNKSGLAGMIDLPSSIEELGDNAFGECATITGFIFRSTTPPTVVGFSFPPLFNNGQAVKKIYVPDSSLSAYQTAWAGLVQWGTPIINALDVISNLPS